MRKESDIFVGGNSTIVAGVQASVAVGKEGRGGVPPPEFDRGCGERLAAGLGLVCL